MAVVLQKTTKIFINQFTGGIMLNMKVISALVGLFVGAVAFYVLHLFMSGVKAFAVVSTIAIIIILSTIPGFWASVGRGIARLFVAITPHIRAGAAAIAGHVVNNLYLWVGIFLLVASIPMMIHGVLHSSLPWFAVGVSAFLLGVGMLVIHFQVEEAAGVFIRRSWKWIWLLGSIAAFAWAMNQLQKEGMHWRAFHTAWISAISIVLAVITIAGWWGKVGAWLKKQGAMLITIPFGGKEWALACLCWCIASILLMEYGDRSLRYYAGFAAVCFGMGVIIIPWWKISSSRAVAKIVR
jgi:hypothetical protein